MDQPEAAATSTNSTDDDGDGPVRWAGVDWSWSDHAVCVIDDAGAATERFTVGHSAAGLARLVTVPNRRSPGSRCVRAGTIAPNGRALAR